MKKSNIVLIGLPGSGKSTLGQRTAQQGGYGFIDLDRAIVCSTGMSIPHIFDRYGESYFRALESAEVQKASALEGYVIATGGGVVGDALNMERLREKGVVIYLACRPEVLLVRTRGDANRPLLAVSPTGDAAGEDERLARLNRLFAVRDPLYRRYSHGIINTEAEDREYLAQTITEMGERLC